MVSIHLSFSFFHLDSQHELPYQGNLVLRTTSCSVLTGHIQELHSHVPLHTESLKMFDFVQIQLSHGFKSLSSATRAISSWTPDFYVLPHRGRVGEPKTYNILTPTQPVESGREEWELKPRTPDEK